MIVMEQVTRAEFIALVARQDAADAEMREMRHDIKQIRHDTHELVETYRALSGGFKVLLWLGKAALAISAVAGAIAIFRNGWFK